MDLWDEMDMRTTTLDKPTLDFLVNATPMVACTKLVVRLAMEAKVKYYMDLQLSNPKFKMLQEIFQEGRFLTEQQQQHLEPKGCYITEAGFHPGLPAVLVRYLAEDFDVINTAHGCGYLNMKDMPYSEAVDELMDFFSDYQAQVYDANKYPDGWSKPGQWDIKSFDMGPQLGKRTAYSMYMQELGPLPNHFPTLQEVGFYMAGSNWLTDFVLLPIVWLGLWMFPKNNNSKTVQSIRTRLGKLLWWGMTLSPPPYTVALQVEVTGSCQNTSNPTNVEEPNTIKKTRTIRLEHTDAYDMTVIPPVACMMQCLDENCNNNSNDNGGSAQRPTGLHMMGYVVEPKRLIQDMKSMGMIIAQDDCTVQDDESRYY